MAYLLDANVFIEVARRYGFDVFPGFWEWLVTSNTGRKVFSVEKVAEELRAGGDELSDWARELGEDFFLPPDKKVIDCMPKVSKWVHGQSYKRAAASDFLAGADYYLVSHALAHGHVVVTHEVKDKGKNRIKIPDACAGLDIKCVNPYAMLKEEEVRFVLDRHRGQ